ncbi:glutamyl-tRNA reductase [Halapricum hydrolyticum]|uniref:Glutamyl-tRNA reductase n=1 Tax=Halapricum hydrolyticum TaxID=2979991 RepID=A0AAE3I8W8_9EURY|nr:glutamyl-tRNA reductase [Halapricum hydrolyticum]MCU4716928.1 glutamyl-tRNA reductase [Halapricum hydrolyticum]MCU4725467.1 glutamyl-tRNA reductase [Halapricum hydrolyticum]
MTQATGVITGMSVSHRQANVHEIESAAATSQRAAAGRLLDNASVTEAFTLQTCNRVEAYVVTDDVDTGRAVLEEYAAEMPDSVIEWMDHEASLRHLMRVATGLESLVIGEDQIIGQVRDAYEDARSVDGIGSVLEHAITKAIHVGERARSETAINDGVVSVGSAAVELAASEHDLDGATAAVIGAGEMATLSAKALDARTDAARLLVVNRTVERADRVLDMVSIEGESLGMDDLERAVSAADVVISATATSEPVVEPALLADAGETVVLDLAQPRDVPQRVGRLSGVTRYDLDALESVTDETRAQRRDAALKVEALIDEAFEELLTQYKRKRADEVISAMYEGAERRKAAELQKAFAKLDLDEDEREVVESMADAIVNQLLAPPTSGLRDAAEADDWSTINTALQLFDPSLEDGKPSIPELATRVPGSDSDHEVRPDREVPPVVRDQLDD